MLTVVCQLGCFYPFTFPSVLKLEHILKIFQNGLSKYLFEEGSIASIMFGYVNVVLCHMFSPVKMLV